MGRINLSKWLNLRRKEPEFDPHDMEHIASGDWEGVLERFTEDMDPWAIDLVKLADRYKSYIERMERFDLEVPARVILIGAVLLRMKADVLREYYENGGEVDESDFAEEEQFIEDMFEFDEESLEPVEEGQLRIPEALPKPPVKKKGQRKVTLDELKDALRDAVTIDKRRQTRQTTRKDADDYGIEVEEDDISSKLDSLFTTLKSYLGEQETAVTFTDLVAEEAKHEKIDKFVNLMHLETEERVECIQPEFLGPLKVKVKDQENN